MMTDKKECPYEALAKLSDDTRAKIYEDMKRRSEEIIRYGYLTEESYWREQLWLTYWGLSD